MAKDAELRSALQDALSDSPEPEGTDEPEAPADDESTPDASEGGQPDATDDDGSNEPEAPEGTGDELTEYFGLDLSGVEPEQRTAILAELRKRDDYIGKLLREPEVPETPDEPQGIDDEPPPELSDQDILQALGLDPDDPFAEETAKVVLPLARQQMAQQQALNQLIEQAELAELDRSWRDSLSGLEREFGSLPPGVDHERVMEFAADNGISHPLDAYWRIMGPGRSEVSRALEAERAKQQKLLDAKRKSSTTRPNSGKADDDQPLQAKNTKAATKEAARKLFAEMGFTDV